MRTFRPYSGLPTLPYQKVWAEIDREALINNFHLLSQKNAGARQIAVVKADAYGHTAAICVDALLSAGCDFFAVSSIGEALDVRHICHERKMQSDILILGYTDPHLVPFLIENDIIQTIIDAPHGLSLAKEAEAIGQRLRTHIAIDTGMNRVGLCARNDTECISATGAVKELFLNEHLRVEGLFTHFSNADDSDDSVFDPNGKTRLQFSRFASVASALEKEGIKLFSHVCNSAATVRFPEFALDGVRLGILLYGARPSEQVVADTSPVMSLHTIVSHVHSIGKGERVSYGGCFVSDSDMEIATLPIGYADGFIRSYSGFEVTVHTKNGDRKAPVIGRICMDQCMIDVTGLGAEVGDRITVFGIDKGDLSRLAAMAETIEYEVLCLISGRVPRISKTAEGGKK